MKTFSARAQQVACFIPLFIIFLFFSLSLSAQTITTGAIRVTLQDSTTKEKIPFANVVLYSPQGKQLGVSTTDMDGEANFKDLVPGRYNLKGLYIGYHLSEMKNVLVSSGKTTYVILPLSNLGNHLQSVEVITYEVPLVEPASLSSQTISREEYQNVAPGNNNSNAGARSLNIKGQRSASTTYFVDGVKVIGSPNVPQQSVEQINVVTGGVPTSQGDESMNMPGQKITRQDYHNMATKDINSVMATSAGVYQADEGKELSVRQREGYPLQGERYEESAESIFKFCTNDPLSTFSSDVDVASYANIRRMLTQGYNPPKESVRIEEMINYFRYKYPEPVAQDVFAIHPEISSCPWNNDHRLLQVGIQARSIKMDDAVPNHLTFLIDVSGSMSSSDKLPLLRDALSMLVRQMRDKDRVAIVVYAGSAGLVLPPTSGSHMPEILQAISHLEAGGSTAGGEGILLAYKMALEQYSAKANNRVILATDGDFNVGVSDDASLVKLIEEKRDQGIFLSVLGFGTGNYQDAKMEKLADKGNGNYAYIDNLLEAKKVLVKEMGGTLVTVAKDVKIQVEFNPKYVKSYRLIGYDNRMLAHEDFKDDKKDAGDVGSGHSVTALYEIVPADGQKVPGDSYKYQKNEMTGAAMSNEVCTIKLRYKEPVEKHSKEIMRVVNDEQISFEKASDNFRFCSAVAEFGLMLRQSQFKGKASIPDVIRIAREAKGEDAENYRAEFIRLAEMADVLANR